MEVEFVTEEMSEDENYGFDDDNGEDYLNFEGERCGICMDIVIDRGVLDCCQHWFCFACIDNWSSITSLCPLCQNEFQVITCLPVYDTVGCTKNDDDTSPRDDDWLVEGKNNTLSFPSYYIDENAVVCLDGNGCKIRSGSVAIEEDSDLDTSIACDSCDKWYHAFCVGFDPDDTCSSWLCPRCTGSKNRQNADRVSEFRQSYLYDLAITDSDSPMEASFSGRVSVSVPDDCETAVVVSLVGGTQTYREPCESVQEYSKDVKNTTYSSISNMQELGGLISHIDTVGPDSSQQATKLPQNSDFLSTGLLHVNADEEDKRETEKLSNKSFDSSLDLENVDQISSSEQFTLPAERRESDQVDSKFPDEKETANICSKRKHRDTREDTSDATFSQKKIKIKPEVNSQSTCLKLQSPESVIDDSKAIPSLTATIDNKSKGLSQKKNDTADIMAIVKGTDRRSSKQIQRKSSSGTSPDKKETAAGLRLKKIMRRAGDDKDSLVLVQELRKRIREAVRNKSSSEIDENLFDPKLLDAFRAALAGSGTENRKPPLDVKAKKALLQKGKVRENLTKKIYGAGGKRKRAWTRECEVEFWKHRCLKTSRPEKVQTLKSVLDLLKDDSVNKKKMPGHDEEQKSSILSRLYLADTSVFPRKNDIRPVAARDGKESHEQKKESGLAEKVSISLPIDPSNRIPLKNNNLSRVNVHTVDGEGLKNSIKGMKAGSTSGGAHQRECRKGTSVPALKGPKTLSDNESTSKPEIKMGDKRKWALEVLARKTAVSGQNAQEKEEDDAILKGNYSYLAQLPKEMRPVLAPSRHNKIPISVRQAQLYRLTEHFLKKANPSSVVNKTAETELAVADAVNIEREVADRSNSKLVYVNLCSQELLRRQDNLNPDRARDLKSSSTEDPSDKASEEADISSVDLAVDEALKNAGLISDSPPNSPDRQIEDNNDDVDSLEKTEEQPVSILEVNSHPDLDIYGDFEYNLEDDDFIGAGALKISNLESEEPKIKMVLSSVIPDKPIGAPSLVDHEAVRDSEASNGSSCLLEADEKTLPGGSTEGKPDECVIKNSSIDGDEDLSLAECEELYGPDKEPIIVKYPETVSKIILDQTMNGESPGENAERESTYKEEDPGKSSDSHVENMEVASKSNSSMSKKLPSDLQKKENVKSKEKTFKNDTKQTENNITVSKKVEAYIKEHIRPLCKSGVITVEQYRWAVGRTEKVMKYHSKEKNANFLIKEGEKVKKLAEQYVEASQKKSNN